MKFGRLEGVPPPSNLGPWPSKSDHKNQGTLSGGISGAIISVAKVPSSGSSLRVAQGNNGDEWPELWDRVPMLPTSSHDDPRVSLTTLLFFYISSSTKKLLVKNCSLGGKNSFSKALVGGSNPFAKYHIVKLDPSSLK